MCSDVVVYPYQIYQARLAGSDALKLIAPALPAKVGYVKSNTARRIRCCFVCEDVVKSVRGTVVSMLMLRGDYC